MTQLLIHTHIEHSDAPSRRHRPSVRELKSLAYVADKQSGALDLGKMNDTELTAFLRSSQA
jgi:hypothetical protein